MGRDRRVYVEFARELDAEQWSRRHAEGTVPDATPYGLHLLGDFGYDVRFRPATAHRTMARRARRHLAGNDVVPALVGFDDRLRSGADIVLCMDKEAGIPAVLRPGGPPVVSGVAWLEDPGALSVPHRLAARLAVSRMAGVFVECSAMIDPLIKGFGAPEQRVHFVRLGIDATHFCPAEWPGGPPLVFSVGDDRMRDHDTLVDAVTRARRDHPDLLFELATTRSVRVDPAFARVHRRRMDDAVRGCYARAHVVAVALHPTRQGSGLTVILEAMASGRSVVVTDNPGLSDYVHHGKTGWLVPAGDPAAMADAVNSLIADPRRARRMGERGRQLVEQQFTTRHMAQDIARVLDLSLPHPDRCG